jgi:hypothetical protein
MMAMPKLPTKWKKGLAAASALAMTAWATFTQVQPQQIGLRETFYIMTGNKVLQPKIYTQFPFVQYTHKYGANTQTIEFNGGGCRFLPNCDSTGDQNNLSAEFRLNYKVIPDAQKLSFHRWEMEKWGTGRNGYWTLTSMLNTSANAILGQKSMKESLNSDPNAFAKAVFNDLSYRLAQNNIPVEVESLELKEFKTWYVPTRTVAYGTAGQVSDPSPR